MDNKGFTFIELIVTLVILGVIAGTVTYGFYSYFSTGRSRAADNIVNVVDYARAVAQTSNYDANIHIKYTDKKCIAEVYTIDNSNTKHMKDVFDICDSKYTIYYMDEIEGSEYKALKDENNTYELTLIISKSGFKSPGYIKEIIIDNDADTRITFIKEVGRAYRVV